MIIATASIQFHDFLWKDGQAESALIHMERIWLHKNGDTNQVYLLNDTNALPTRLTHNGNVITTRDAQ